MKVTLQRSCGWLPPDVYEVGAEISEDEILAWCAHDGTGPIACVSLPWEPYAAERYLAEQLVQHHGFVPEAAARAAQSLLDRLNAGA